MKVSFALLCDYALLSSDMKLSALGFFSRIRTAQFPAIHPRAFLVFEIELDYTEVGKDFTVKVECVDADGAPILQARTQIRTEGSGKPGDRPRIPQFLQLPPLTFKKAGAYDINIFAGGDLSPYHLTFDVVLIEPSEQGSGPPIPEPPEPTPAD